MHDDPVLLSENLIDAEGAELGLTRSLWSTLLNNSLEWAQQGWGGYVTGNSALYINPVLNQDEAKESMKPLVEWATQLRESVPVQVQKDVKIVQGEFGTWGHFFDIFADGNSAVSINANFCDVSIEVVFHRIWVNRSQSLRDLYPRPPFHHQKPERPCSKL